MAVLSLGGYLFLQRLSGFGGAAPGLKPFSEDDVIERQRMTAGAV
jgi:hypothetical protein